MQCIEYEPKIVLYLCGELEIDEAAALESHLKVCAECSAFAQRERALLQVLEAGNQTEVDAGLLAQCRMDLSEAIAREGQPGFWPRLVGKIAGGASAFNLSLHDWMVARPAFSAAAFVLVGVTVAMVAPRVLTSPAGSELTRSGDPIMTVQPSDPPTTSITGIKFQPVSGQIEVQGTAQTTFENRGTVDDPSIRRALIQVAQNSNQFNSDARMDSLELLKARGNDEEVRQALCEVARKDRNPGIRLKAMEALLQAQQDELVRQTMIDALLNDQNPGVRVAAVNGLQNIAARSDVRDDRLMQVLRDRMEKDPSTYIRLQSAAAVRQLQERGVY